MGTNDYTAEMRRIQEDAALRNIWNAPSSAVAIETPRSEAMPLTIAGSFRVYFHRLNPDGLPWCVSPAGGGWELAVRDVEIAVPSRAVYQPKDKPDDEDGRPSAWIEASGVLTVGHDGKARIAP